MPVIDLLHLTMNHPLIQTEKGPITVLQAGIDPNPAPRGLYLHIPFCFHKCHYCDFYSIVDSRNRQELFVERLCTELDIVRGLLIRPLETIFIGGGTPTLLAPMLFERLLQSLNHLPLASDPEFTVEANPETVTCELADVLVAGGVNRISLGAQSFNEKHLKTLERWHDPKNVRQSVDILRRGGISSINLDLIFAIPGQTPGEWEADLMTALDLQPDHLSCYNLTYEPNTALTQRMKQGEFTPLDDEIEVEMYRMAQHRLADMGFEPYEISAWSKPDKQCFHNLLYWRNESWWACGPGAAGHVDGFRWKNVPRLDGYLHSEGLPPVMDVERADPDSRVGETLMMGLRLTDGIEREQLENLLAQGKRGEARRVAIEKHSQAGLLECTEDRLRLTDDGLLLADTVLVDLI